jgi:hypothetical protein
MKVAIVSTGKDREFVLHDQQNGSEWVARIAAHSEQGEQSIEAICRDLRNFLERLLSSLSGPEADSPEAGQPVFTYSPSDLANPLAPSMLNEDWATVRAHSFENRSSGRSDREDGLSL